MTDTTIQVRARSTDPDTSHQAALAFESKQSKARRSVAVVVKILADHPAGLTDFEIREKWEAYWGPGWSYTLPSKARLWAREEGLVKHVGYGVNGARRVRKWGLGNDLLQKKARRVCPHCGGAL